MLEIKQGYSSNCQSFTRSSSVDCRPLRCDNCLCCPCLNQTVRVECPPGVAAGFIEQSATCFVPSFDINDAFGNTTYRLEGKYKFDLDTL